MKEIGLKVARLYYILKFGEAIKSTFWNLKISFFPSDMTHRESGECARSRSTMVDWSANDASQSSESQW